MITRRLFNSRLLAASTGAAFALWLSGCGQPKARYSVTEGGDLFDMTSRALGQPISISLNEPDETRRTRLFDGAMARLDELGAIFNPDIEMSQISRLNANGEIEAPSNFLLSLNQFAREMKIMTNDTFNIADAPLKQLYAKTPRPDPDELSAALALGKGHAIGTADRLRMSRAGTQINFKDCLSGFTADILAAQLAGADVINALITVGRAHYAIGTRPDGTPWSINVGASALPLDNAALATSAPHQGTLIDPRAGALPALHQSVAVIATQTVMADTLATAFSLMPISEIMTRQKAILGGGLTQKLDVYVTNLSGQFIALRG